MTSPAAPKDDLPRPYQRRNGATVIEQPGDAAGYWRSVSASLPDGMPTKTRLEVYQELAAGVRACTACGLCATRHNAVPGIGLLKTGGIVIIGEAPGEDEDIRGEPFVGRSGTLVNQWLAAAGMTRAEVYIMNGVNCRPPKNRDPHPSEQVACDHWMVEQLQLLQPKVIIALGKHAGNAMTSHRELARESGKLRAGSPWKCAIPGVESAQVYCLYHPAYVLRPQGSWAGPVTQEEFVEACNYARNIT